jgi:hypothetical protein
MGTLCQQSSGFPYMKNHAGGNHLKNMILRCLYENTLDNPWLSRLMYHQNTKACLFIKTCISFLLQELLVGQAIYDVPIVVVYEFIEKNSIELI